MFTANQKSLSAYPLGIATIAAPICISSTASVVVPPERDWGFPSVDNGPKELAVCYRILIKCMDVFYAVAKVLSYK